LSAEGALNGERGSNSIGRTRKHGEAAVTFTTWAHQRAVVVLDEHLDQLVVARERRLHRITVLLPLAGAALDIGEQEGHCPCRQRACWRCWRRRRQRSSGRTGRACGAARRASAFECGQQFGALSIPQSKAFS